MDEAYKNWRQDDPRFNREEAWPEAQFPDAEYRRFRDAGCLVCALAEPFVDGKEDVPPRPNDQQEKVINSIINKILTTLNPINDEVKEVPPLETPKQKKKK